MNILFLIIPLLILNDVSTKSTRKKAVVPKGGYPKEVLDIFQRIPEQEFYEPPKGKNWGEVPPTALFPYETSSNSIVYFRDTAEPESKYDGYKYIILYYDYPNRGHFKTKKGNPIYVPFMLLVPNNFGRAISNYLTIPVYNPSFKKTVQIKVLRRYKVPVRIHSPNHKYKTQSLAGPKAAESTKNISKEKLKEMWRNRLIGKTKKVEEAKKYKKALKYAKTHIDYWRAYEDRELLENNRLNSKGRLEVMNGGFNLGVNKTLEYLKPEQITKQQMLNSIMFPPIYSNYPQMPTEAKVNFLDLENCMIAKIIPPLPTIPHSKWTFFFLAPTKFKYPDGRDVYLPVYILVPENSEERPSDLKVFHTFKYVNVPDWYEHTKAVNTTGKPVWTSKKFESIIMKKEFVNMPQKPFDNAYYVDSDHIEAFLEKHKLINKGVVIEMKDIQPRLDPLKKLLKKIVDSFSNAKGLKSKIFFSLKNHVQKDLRANKLQAWKTHMNTVHDLKIKNRIERNRMNVKVNELNMKLKAIKLVIDAQKKALLKKQKAKALDDVKNKAKDLNKEKSNE